MTKKELMEIIKYVPDNYEIVLRIFGREWIADKLIVSEYNNEIILIGEKEISL